MSCGGDSGSPLVFFDSQKEHYVQVGVVSGGTCQSYSDPTIFARVEDHDTLEFIRKQFWDNIPATSAKAIEKLLNENEDLKEKINNLEKMILQINQKDEERKNENEKLKTRITKLESTTSQVSEAKKVLILNINNGPIDDSSNEILFQYYFSAFSSSTSTIKNGDFVTFEKFHVKSGDTFDLSTGTFTAPASGVYEFTFSGNTDGKANCLIKVHKDGDEFLSFYDTGGYYGEDTSQNIYGSLGSSWIVSLDAEDTIRLKVEQGKLQSDEYRTRILTGKLLEINS